MKKDEGRQGDRNQQSQKKLLKAVKVAKAEYKEETMKVLQHRGLHSMWLRMQFWINKFLNILHMPKQQSYDKPVMNFELLGI
jgi:hypothetical protein